MDYANLYSIEAEQAIIGGIIIDNEVWAEVSNKLEKTDFYKREHQIIFDIMTFLVSKNEPIDSITLTNILNRNSNLEKKSSTTYINNIIKSTTNTKNILSYVNIVKDKSTLRQIINLSKEIIEFSLNSKTDNVNDVLEMIEKKFLSISKKINKNEKFADISDILSKTIKKIEMLNETNSSITGLASGFKDLDTLTSGFHKSDLIIIAGRPSMGKSTLAINIAQNVLATLNIPIVIFSMEMSSEQIIMRLLSSLGQINLQKLRTGTLDKSDWPRLTAAVATLLNKKNLFIDDSGALTPFDIKNKIKQIYKIQKNIGLIIIDYIQLIKIPGLQDNRSREIAEISRALKILAKELNVPIIVLSQLNRSSEQRNDKRPLMSDLRESGAIEQDADLVIFIYKDELKNKNLNKKISEIIVAKQRNGPTGKINLNFIPEYCKFEDPEEDDKNLF